MTQPIRTSRRRLAASFSFFLLAILLMAACSDDDPVAPDPTPLPEVSGVLGAAGGTLKSSDGSLELAVPAGALTGDTEISIKQVAAADVPGVGAGMQVLAGFRMTPAGLRFGVPATLALAIDLPVPAKNRVRRVGIPVAVVSDDILEIPRDRNIQEILELTIDQNAAPAQGVVTLRGLSMEGAVGIPVGKGEAIHRPTITTFNEWNEAPRELDPFENRVGLETSAGLNLRASVTFKVTDSVNLETDLADGEVLVAQTEGATQDGGYRRDYVVDYLAAASGPANLRFGMAYELEFDYGLIYGEDFTHPAIYGYTNIIHRLEDIALTVEPRGSNSEFPDVGLYPGEAAAEAILRVRALQGFKYNDTVLTSGGDGTRIRSLSRTNPLAIRSNAFHAPGQSTYGAFLAQEATGGPVSAGLTYFQHGPSGILVSQWDEGINDFGWGQLGLMGHNVTDGQPYGGDASSGGVVFADFTAGTVPLMEWDAQNSWFNSVGALSSFPGATANPVTAAVRPGGGAVVVTDGSPGRIYFHDRMDYFADAVYLGDAGDSPRRLRTAGGLGVISNYGSGDLSILTWSDTDEVNLAGTVSVGDGPVGIDLMPMDGGNVAVASTGYNDNTFTVTVLSPSGAVISNVTTSLPAGAEGPGHIAWMWDPDLRLLVSNNITGNVAVVDSGLR